MRNWVYRRPYFRATRPKIPLFKGGPPLAALRHLRAVRRRRHIIARRVVQVLGAAQATVTHPPIRRQIANAKPKRAPAIHRALLPSAPTFVGKQGPIIRALRAVQRMRRRMRERLRWKPIEEIPPIVVPQVFVHAIPRGTVLTAGAVEATIFTAGAKRGRVGGDHG